MAGIRLEALAPKEQVEAFQRRGVKLHPSFSWQDVAAGEHAKLFTVAKSTGFDILGDLEESLRTALSEGKTFREWSSRIRPILQEKGWWGFKEVIDPQTGEKIRAELGTPRRLTIIYDVNMRVSHAVGKWNQILRTAENRPWLRYTAVLDERTRKSHRRWHGIILRYDHDFWNTHFPPNGWRCRCTVSQLSDRDLRRRGWKPTAKPPSAPGRKWTNKRTGEVTLIPPGVDPGWAHHPGKVAQTAHQAVVKLADKSPKLAARAPVADPGLASQLESEFTDWVRQVEEQIDKGTARPRGVARAVGVLDEQVQDALPAVTGSEPVSAVVMIDDRALYHMLRDTKQDRRTAAGLPATPNAAEVALIPAIIAAPEAVYWDRETESLLYIFTPVTDDRRGKVAIRLDYLMQIRDGQKGKRGNLKTNSVRTIGFEEPDAFSGDRYTRLR